MKRSEDDRDSRGLNFSLGGRKLPKMAALRAWAWMSPNLEMTSAIENDVTESLSHVQLLQLANFKTPYFIDKQLFCEFHKLGKKEDFFSITVAQKKNTCL